MEITPYLPGQTLRADMLQFPILAEQDIAGGPTSGGTELVIATITIPALPVPTMQVPSASCSLVADAAGNNDRWEFRIRDDNVSGTIRGNPRWEVPGTIRFPVSIGNGMFRSVAASTPATYVATVVRLIGDGTVSVATGVNLLSVVVYPDPASL